MQKILIQSKDIEWRESEFTGKIYVSKGLCIECEIEDSRTIRDIINSAPLTLKVANSKNEVYLTPEIAKNSLFMYIND